MTTQDVIDQAAAAGFELFLRDDGKPSIRHPNGARPNAALLAELKARRREVVRLLGGLVEAERCGECTAWVYEAEDSEAFCFQRSCPMRRSCR